MRQNWPEKLWLVRHGQSQGNVARDIADEEGLHEIDIDVRDVDVPLSELGHQQAEATGRWLAALPPDERPEVILSSPYLRARQTAEAICKAGGMSGPTKLVVDERLRFYGGGALHQKCSAHFLSPALSPGLFCWRCTVSPSFSVRSTRLGPVTTSIWG